MGAGGTPWPGGRLRPSGAQEIWVWGLAQQRPAGVPQASVALCCTSSLRGAVWEAGQQGGCQADSTWLGQLCTTCFRTDPGHAEGVERGW